MLFKKNSISIFLFILKFKKCYIFFEQSQTSWNKSSISVGKWYLEIYSSYVICIVMRRSSEICCLCLIKLSSETIYYIFGIRKTKIFLHLNFEQLCIWGSNIVVGKFWTILLVSFIKHNFLITELYIPLEGNIYIQWLFLKNSIHTTNHRSINFD